MNNKKTRLLVLSALGLICLSAGLMVIYGPGPGPIVPAPGAAATAERMLAEARAGSETRESAPPSYNISLTTANAGSRGAIGMVTGAEFSGVAEDPQSIMGALEEMSGSGKNKTPTVHLTDADLRKKVILTEPEKNRQLSASAVLRLGAEDAGSGAGGQAMITAPVNFQIFKSSETWKAFADSHQGRFPKADFSREHMLILVSVSDLPSGIFKAAGVKKKAGGVVVLYRVDPLAMAAGTGAKEKDFYSAVPVPKNLVVKLEQIP